ncbi:inosine-uridine nucleoside N-ribohydrolase [Legionella oakridgensis RV-2-2007]|nr:inosine-uridine nucleoside N-ribohydrolase [Legionella oakridgensis RV-2-2007]
MTSFIYYRFHLMLTDICHSCEGGKPSLIWLSALFRMDPRLRGDDRKQSEDDKKRTIDITQSVKITWKRCYLAFSGLLFLFSKNTWPNLCGFSRMFLLFSMKKILNRQNNLILGLLCFLVAPVLAKQPIIIDTDLDKDDWAAIAYLINQPQLDIRAITVEGAGASDCVHGISNLVKSLQYWHRTDIPIACNNQLGMYKTHFPSTWRNPGTNYFKKLRAHHSKPVLIKTDAAKLINEVLQQSEEPVVVMAIGPLINIAAAIRLDTSLWLTKVKGFYFSGGNFTKEATSIAKYYPKTETQTWNLFIAPEAGYRVFKQSLSVVLNTHKTARLLHNNNSMYENIDALNQQHQLNRFGKIVYALQSSKNNYWGDALTAMMLVMPEVCRYQDVRMNVLFKPFQYSGVSKLSSEGIKVHYCKDFNLPLFQRIFMQKMSSSNSQANDEEKRVFKQKRFKISEQH